MSPRESLALMGAHTIGGFSTFATHIDYAWVRHLDSSRTKVFNNEYYKELAARPAHVKVRSIKCTINTGMGRHIGNFTSENGNVEIPKCRFHNGEI